MYSRDEDLQNNRLEIRGIMGIHVIAVVVLAIGFAFVYTGVWYMQNPAEAAAEEIGLILQLISILFGGLFVVASIVGSLVYGRKIVLEPEGMSIHYGLLNQFYRWDELQMKDWIDYDDYTFEYSRYRGGFYLYKRNISIKPGTFYFDAAERHPFSGVCIHFRLSADEVMRRRGSGSRNRKAVYGRIFEADRQQLLDFFERNAIEIRGLERAKRVW